MSKQDDLADLLAEYSEYLALDGQDGRAHAYDKAARTIRSANYLPPDPADLDGVGDSIRTTIAKWQRSGTIQELDELKEQYDWYDELGQIDHVGPARARTLHEKLRCDTARDVVLRGDDLLMIDGIGPATKEKIIQSAKKVQE